MLALLFSGVVAAAFGQIVTEFPTLTAQSDPPYIVAGPDGATWFTEYRVSRIGRITSDGVITEFPVPGGPSGICAGPDGALWYTQYNASRIGRMTTTGVVTEFTIPTAGSNPEAIVVGPDGALWFTEMATNKIGRITTAGAITEFAIPTARSTPLGIVAGPDGALWFTEVDGNKIGRITTSGAITEFVVPTPNSNPWMITAGMDGALWFAEDSANQIGRITTSGSTTEFPVPTPNSHPQGIVAGPDGALWFTERTAGKIGRITTAGAVSELAIPTPNSNPYMIAAGPDGNLWFTERSASQIGRIQLTSPGPCVVDPATLCLNGGRFEVRVTWSVPSQGRSGTGAAVPLTGDTGYFWFFNSDNVELVIKALDAQAVNGHFWIFYGALSDVRYTITVRDAVTGASRTYLNPAGTLASVADTSAFSPAASFGLSPEPSAAEIESRSTEELYGLYTALTSAAIRPKAAAVAACMPGGTTLCLNQSRFQVTVDWEVPSQGRSGHGTAIPITSDTGYFWFFDNTNIELVIKALDARTVNGHLWVFYGALSDVQYTITVTDTQTEAVRIYANPSGTLASVADTSAF